MAFITIISLPQLITGPNAVTGEGLQHSDRASIGQRVPASINSWHLQVRLGETPAWNCGELLPVSVGNNEIRGLLLWLSIRQLLMQHTMDHFLPVLHTYTGVFGSMRAWGWPLARRADVHPTWLKSVGEIWMYFWSVTSFGEDRLSASNMWPPGSCFLKYIIFIFIPR